MKTSKKLFVISIFLYILVIGGLVGGIAGLVIYYLMPGAVWQKVMLTIGFVLAVGLGILLLYCFSILENNTRQLEIMKFKLAKKQILNFNDIQELEDEEEISNTANFCPKCGKKVVVSDLFCRHCGEDIYGTGKEKKES